DEGKNTERGGEMKDQKNATAGEHDALPHQYKTARRDLAQGDLKEKRSHPRADTESDCSDGDGLQQDHARQAPVGNADRLQRTKLLQVFERKEIESLSSDHRAHDDGDGDGDPEVNGDASVLQVVADAIPPELVCGSREQSGLRLDWQGNFVRVYTRCFIAQHV